MSIRIATILTFALVQSVLADEKMPPTVTIRAENEEFLRQDAATFHFTLGRPKIPRLARDGSAVLFLRSPARSFVQSLYEFDCRTGKERVLLAAEQFLAGGEEVLSAEEKAQRERLRLAARGIARFDLSDDGSKILVPLSGNLFVVDRATGKSSEVKSRSPAFPLDPSFSPDGSKLACVRDGEIFVTDLATGSERQITSGAGGPISNGTAEFVAQEEMGRHRGYWWSPDSHSIAFQQTDTSGVETFHIADAVKPESLPQPWPYPRPGGKNAVVKFGIVSADGGQTKGNAVQRIEWDREKYPYLATVKWDENSPLTILVQNRTQTEEVLYAIDGKLGRTHELLRETDAAWINLEQACPLWLKNGVGFLWLTERTGEWSLELRNAQGKLARTLTPPQFGLFGLAGVNEESGVAYVTVCDDPTQMQIWSVSLDGTGTPQRLTTERGMHLFSVGKYTGAYLHSFSSADGRVKTRVVSSTGEAIGELKSVAEEPPFLPQPEFLTVGPQSFQAVILRPRSFDKSKKYPVIVHVYGGPKAVVVNSAVLAYLFEQWLADQGFIVVSVDGRGTPGRGRGWERAIKNNLIDVALQDQVEGVQALGAKFPEMDMSRVGIEGWSFGGYFSAMAAMKRPDIYKASVAGAPVCDFRDYDTHYTERYLGLPEDNPAGYKASSVLTYCQDLTVPLLIIHGTADDNVYFFHSLKMAEALFRAGKKFEFLPLAGFTHMVPDPEVNVRRHSRVAAFFKEHLGAPR